MGLNTQTMFERGYKEYSDMEGGFDAVLFQKSSSYRKGYRAARTDALGETARCIACYGALHSIEKCPFVKMPLRQHGSIMKKKVDIFPTLSRCPNCKMVNPVNFCFCSKETK